MFLDVVPARGSQPKTSPTRLGVKLLSHIAGYGLPTIDQPPLNHGWEYVGSKVGWCSVRQPKAKQDRTSRPDQNVFETNTWSNTSRPCTTAYHAPDLLLTMAINSEHPGTCTNEQRAANRGRLHETFGGLAAIVARNRTHGENAVIEELYATGTPARHPEKSPNDYTLIASAKHQIHTDIPGFKEKH
ncbi:hypothetical protein Bbelb_262330 [Branchiostoma belcheri]|nr:hypothetical protein Bbelb_262330 [Branchiostoma belcheri]